MPYLRVVILISALLTFALVACGDDDTGGDGTAAENGEAAAETEPTPPPEENAPAPSGEAVRSAKVQMVDYSFEPPTVTIQTGGKVIWQNEGEEAHTATAEDGSFDTAIVEPGKLKSETASFKEPGTFTYICEIHPEMTGTVEVVS